MSGREFIDHRQADGGEGEFANRVDEIEGEEPPHRCFLTISQAIGAKCYDGIANSKKKKTYRLLDG